MPISLPVRSGALLSSVALLAMSGSPALAAEPVARASATATAATIALAGQTQGSGTYAVTNDGTSERATGTNQPAAGLVNGQSFLQLGTLAQDARTSVIDGNGVSQACAGAAGSGATVAAVGNSASCLTGGQNVTVNAGTLNLSGVQLTTNPALAPLNDALETLLVPLGTTLNQATTTFLTALGNPAIRASLGAVQSSCQSDRSSASGTANIANAGVFVDLPALPGQGQQTLTIVSFPANPPPNTKVVTGLNQVSQVIVSALRTSLASTASGPLSDPLIIGPALTAAGVTAQTVQDQLINAVIAQLQPVLQPLEQNVVNGTLNKQTKASANQIEVTALDVDLLPVAGSNAIQLDIGTSSCGPAGRVAAPAQATSPGSARATNKPTPSPATPVRNPTVPTSVPAGLADGPLQNAPLGPWALAGLGALLAASVGAGATAYRRQTRS